MLAPVETENKVALKGRSGKAKDAANDLQPALLDFIISSSMCAPKPRVRMQLQQEPELLGVHV